MDREIVAYMANWCSDCWRSRRVLQAAGVPFREIDVDRVPGAEDEMRRVNGGSGKVPTILLGDRVLIEPSDCELSRAIDEMDRALQEA